MIYHADCLIKLKDLPEKSIDLIILDPPYNIGKDVWDKIPDYIEWMKKVFIECQRVLKDNGSLYLFHNDIEILSDLMINLRKTKFIFKQFIIWNKRFEGVKNKGFLNGYIETNQLRNYQKMVEYLVYYTFQDETGLEKSQNRIRPLNPFVLYLKSEFKKADVTKMDIAKLFLSKTGKLTGCVRNWILGYNIPTKEQYLKIKEYLNNEYLQKPYENLKKEYEYLKKEYEKLRQEYEDLRYTFNNQKTHHSVWNYEIAKKQGHLTPKPVKLIENIIKHSSNEGDIVLDPFAGSGTTAIACKNLNRKYILIEKEKIYIDLINKRLFLYQKPIKHIFGKK